MSLVAAAAVVRLFGREPGLYGFQVPVALACPNRDAAIQTGDQEGCAEALDQSV